MTETSGKACVLCMKWGTPFSAHDVNMLFAAVRDHLPVDHDFICITDDTTGLDPAIKTHALSFPQLDQSEWVHGKWPKLLMFDRRVVQGYETALFLDLDLLVTGELTPLLHRVRERGGLYLMPKFRAFVWRAIPAAFWDRVPGLMNLVTRGNSSVVGFIPKQQFHLYDDFDAPRDLKAYKNDQDYISGRAWRRRCYPKDWCIGIIHLVPYWPLSLIFRKYRNLPKRPKIVIFNGNPKAHELVGQNVGEWGTKRRRGFGSIGWVETYLQKYSA
ncbi:MULTISPECIES: hypothetical protein [unclassified Ruegeria]|uniref:hypothetical protein n=1 Tax=unclassified Ruegeria TaxID=2625375 RepID=UPI001ADAAD4E|nr:MULTISPECIES: hypothetical protein [unclassified Ruegeria]MBO9413232.1 hypothetical protein [Ruegeria sp. R8_1]MBO9413897.1 hypothetical protein [Ruegeria sp. R8_2]